MIKLEKCPHCGSDVILCKLNGITYVAYGFSIVCPGCGLETKISVNPNANCPALTARGGDAVTRRKRRGKRVFSPHARG